MRVHAAVLNRPDFHQGVSHLEDVVEPVFFATDDEVILGASSEDDHHVVGLGDADRGANRVVTIHHNVSTN